MPPPNIATRTRPGMIPYGLTPSGDIVPLRVDDDGILATSAEFGGDISLDGLTLADGADATQGAIADAAVTGDNSGTVSAKLRGLSKMIADAWDSVNHLLKTSAVQSGTWSVRNQDGSGNTLSSHSSALDVSVRSQATAFDVAAAVGAPVFVTPTPSTTGGWSPSVKAALSNTNSQVKSGAATLGGWYIYNPNATVAYVQIYDTATGSISVGTTVAKLSIGIPPTSAANLAIDNGINFANAICVAATTTATGASAPSSALDCNFWYK